MTSYEQRLELEHEICELQRHKEDSEKVLEQKEIALRIAVEDEAEKYSRWRYHNKNRLHVKNKADYVDLKEYRTTLKLLAESAEDCQEAGEAVHKLRRDVEFFRAAVERDEGKIACARAELGSYGQVIEFRRVA